MMCIFGCSNYIDDVRFLMFVSDFFFFKQKTAYEMRISDWSSDVCSSDLPLRQRLADPPWHNRWQATRPITLAMLLEHSAGWFDMGRAEFDSADPTPQIGRASCRERVCQYV